MILPWGPLLLAACAAQTSAANVPGQARCALAQKAVQSLAACVETAHGVVLAGTAEEAVRLAGYATAGEARFETHFDMPPPRYAVMTSTSPDHFQALRSAGYKTVLPWKSATEMQALLLQSIRQAAEVSARAQGLPDAEHKVVVDRAVSQSQGAVLASWRASQEGVVPHELGHLWLIGGFWPGEGDRIGSGGKRYGSAGPDWLDETAAILMEDERLAQMRRDQFAQVYHSQPGDKRLRGISRDQLIDFAGFLTGEHPNSSRTRPGIPGASQPARPKVSVVVRSDGGDGSNLMYYLQSRMLADYLIQKSGRVDVFASIAREIAKGQSFAQWLQASGRQYQLPSSIAALEADWRSWVQERVKVPAAAAVG